MASLPTILLILAAFSVGATVIAILIAMRSGREARSAIFPIVREEETVRARRARVASFLLSAVTALFLGGWLATLRLPQLNPSGPAADLQASQPVGAATAVVFATITPTPVIPAPSTQANPVAQAVQPTQAAVVNTPVAPPPSPTPLPPPPVEPTLPPATQASVVEVVPTDTPTPTPAPPTATSVPPTIAPTETPTPAPPTATPTLGAATAAQIPTTGPRTPAPPGVRMGPIQFALNITPDIEAVSPRYLFPRGTKSVYAVFPYSGMVDGVNFMVIWYQNGVELWRDQQVWRWGKEAQFYSFLNPPSEGLYKLELYVNDTVAATGIFEIR